MTLSREELIEKLGVGNLFGPAPSSAESELLRRAAIPKIFDRALAERVLSTELPGTELARFDTLVASSAIERVPETDGIYRMRDSARTSYLQSFRTEEYPGGTPEFQRISRRLETELRARGPTWKLERLRHSFAANPQRARAEFDKLWRSAEDRFELTELQDLLEILREQLIFGNAELSALESRLGTRLAARGMWLDEWYRTSRMFVRGKFLAIAEALFKKGAPSFMLQLYAGGGMGKTMFIRWLLARYSVSKSIPCAKVDFDDEDAPKVASAPWRLLLRFAEQLDPQLPGDGLKRVLSLAQELTQHTGRDVSHAPEHVDQRTSEELDRRLGEAFVDALNDGRGEEPVLLVLDTMEEALRGGTETLDLLRMLIGLRSGTPVRPPCPALRVVLAGRFDLRKKLDGLDELVGGAGLHVELDAFDPSEVESFFRVSRKLDIDAELARKLGKNLGNMPWKLALAADLVELGAVKAERIGESSDLDVLWLTERVLLRIRKDDPERRPIADAEVRWLLRYGCVPRRLTRDLVHGVLMRYLPDSVAGTSDHDSGKDDLPEELAQQELFPVVREGKWASDSGVDDLWERLSSYAGTYATAWVWFVGEDRDTLVFQKDVSRPMRRLLAKHPIHALLHADLVGYFEAEAARDPERWTQYTREAVYHRFQREGARAAHYFDEKLEQARAHGERAHFELVDELTGAATCDDYVDDEERPRILRGANGEDVPLIAPDTLSRAWLERASHGIVRTEQISGDRTSEWNGVASSLAASDRYRTQAEPAPAEIEARREYVFGALSLYRGEASQAASALERALPQLSGAERRRAMLFIGDAQALLYRYEAAIPSYRMLLAELEAAGAPLSAILEAHERLALSYRNGDRYEEAIAECDRAMALPEAIDAPVPAVAARLLTLAGQCLLRSGAPTAAALLIQRGRREIELQGTQGDAQNQLLIAEVQRQLAVAECGDLEQAAQALAEIESSVEQNSTSVDVEVRAAVSEAGGLVHAMRLDFARATAYLDRARELWGPVSRERAARCLAHSIALQLREIGSLKHAERLLADAQRMSLDPRSERRFELALLRVEWRARCEDPGDPRLALESAAELAVELAPRVGVELALAELRYGEADARSWSRLTDALSEVQGTAARLELLSSLERHPGTLKVPGEAAERLRSLILVKGKIARSCPGSASELPDRDVALLQLRLAEVMRWLGMRKDALKALDSAEHHIVRHRAAALYRRLLLARDRLGWKPRDPTCDVDLELLREAGKLSSPLLRAAWIEHAERLCDAEALDRARDILRELERLRREEGAIRSQWDARQKLLQARVSEGGSARQALLLAIQDYAELDDQLRVRELEQRLATLRGPEMRPQVDAREAAPRQVMDEDLAGSGLRITLRHEEDLLPATLFAPVGSQAPYSRLLVNMLAQEPAKCARLLSSVLEPWLSREGRDESAALSGATVCLEAKDPRLQVAPWELALAREAGPGSRVPDFLYRIHDSERQTYKSVRWIQTALNRLSGGGIAVDGVLGPQTRAALGKLQRDSGLLATGFWNGATRAQLLAALRTLPRERRPHALMLLPSRIWIDKLRFHHTPTIDVERRLGNSCSQVTLLGLDEIERAGSALEALRKNPPSLVFLRGRMRESSSRSHLAVDLAADGRMASQLEGSSARLTVSMLDRLIEVLGSGQASPAVVLEVSPSGHLHEDLQQLLLRNFFAAELFSLGGPLAVVAGGFYDPFQESAMLEVLEEALGLGLSLEETVRELRSMATRGAGEDPFARVTLRAIALFAYDPGLALALPREDMK